MIPTCYLRQVPIEIIEGEGSYQTYRIDGYRLQQWWSTDIHLSPALLDGEWRDVEIWEEK